MMQIMARPFLKTSGFRGTVKFDFASLFSGVWWTIFNCNVCESKLKIDKLTCRLGE